MRNDPGPGGERLGGRQGGWRGNMIPELLRFIEIEHDTMDLGHEIWRLLEPHADGVVEDFYAKVKRFEVNPHITDAAIGRLVGKQKEHWASLFGSAFDADYANRVRRVGIQHRGIALNPMWYVLGYMSLKIAFMRVLAEAALPPIRKGRLLKTLDKYVAFDMALALSTYEAVLLE
jgi:hypothetical protein